MGRVKENLQTFYTCGQCKEKIFNLRSEPFDIPCPECGWGHGAKKKNDIPPKFKVDLSQYG